MRAPFPYLGNSWADCAEIWCVVRDQLARQFTQTQGRVHLHVRTCVPLFRISGTAGRIALKMRPKQIGAFQELTQKEEIEPE